MLRVTKGTIPTIVFLFFLVVPAFPAQAIPCKTEREVKADALAGFFLIQKITAEKCEARKEFRNVVQLELMVHQKFKTRIDAAGKIRASYLVRIYGKRGLDKLLRADEAFKSLGTKNIKPTVGLCSRLPSELVRQLTGGWAYVGQKVEQLFKTIKANPKIKICKRV